MTDRQAIIFLLFGISVQTSQEGLKKFQEYISSRKGDISTFV